MLVSVRYPLYDLIFEYLQHYQFVGWRSTLMFDVFFWLMGKCMLVLMSYAKKMC
jgi:hypothetical protein